MRASKNLHRSIRRCLVQLLQRVRGFFRPRATGSRTNVSARSASLCALTLAAMALPGVMLQPACAAEGDAVDFQYSHYWEGKRNLYGVTSKFDPIQVDSLYDTAKFTLTDRLKGVFNFSQDTWSGATPISTAPAELRGNRTTSVNGVVSGASPYITSGGTNFYLDKTTLQPLKTNGFGQLLGGTDNRLVHTLSGASPETRKQLDFKLSYEWDKAALYMGGGSSMENDYQSRFGNMGGRWDFNQKLTSLNLGASYTNSQVNATLDHDATPYILDACNTGDETCNYASSTSHIDVFSNGNKVLHGTRQDWGTSVGLTQVLNKRAQIEMRLGYLRNDGYLANPYKVVQVAFIDPDQQSSAPAGAYLATVQALMEQRPDVRNQGMLDIRYAQYIDATDAGLHLGYRYYRDDWGIKAHTMEAEWAQPFGNSWIGDGWTITPRARYYSQEAADFYTTFLVTNQAPIPFFDRSKLPAHYSSDYRLSGFGTMSGGGYISKLFRRGIKLDLGFEYYAHAGDLKLGGGGEGSYADFHYYTVNAALKIDLDTIASTRNASGDDTGRHDHGGGDNHHANRAPAGVLFDHMLSKAGDFMIGYRYMYRHQAGQMLHGSNSVSDQTLVKNGCNGNPCFITPTEMNMHMHMLEIMYAPTDWLTLMLMPQFVDMNMSMRKLDGAPTASGDDASLVAHHTLHEHTTGGIGDTSLYALFKVFDELGQHGHATLGLSAPTGDVGEKYRDTHQVDAGYMDYGMQLGSGTWDFKPSLTYTGQMNPWSWGGQLSGTVRMQDKNRSGYQLGDVFQSTAWGSYSLLEGLSASVRGLYTREGSIDGEFTGTFHKLGPNDYTSNYGGRFWDVGLGLTAVIPRGSFKGNRFAFEWLQPVKDDVNGYQLERKGFLTASWSVDF